MTATITARPAPRAARQITGLAGMTLADVQREFPRYCCWAAVSGRCYARPRNARPGDRAPVTGSTPAALRQQILQHQTAMRDAAITETLALIFGPAPAPPSSPPPPAAPIPNKKLRAWRENRGLTRAQMAEALNNTSTAWHDHIVRCSPELIGRWESGHIPWPSRKYQAALHDLTGRHPATLGFTPREGTPGTGGQR
jgi:hypothetical protein